MIGVGVIDFQPIVFESKKEVHLITDKVKTDQYFRNINIYQYFNNDFDIKEIWDSNRFYELSSNIDLTQLKDFLIHWTKENPLGYGLNWLCPMEVAIRVANLSISIHINQQSLKNDNDFSKLVAKVISQHCNYLSIFPEYNHKTGFSTNHGTSDFAGLLIGALSLKKTRKVKSWINQAIKGLEACIRYQIYENGVAFEGSIPYHRLVVEMFAYSAIFCNINEIHLSDKYYEILFRMIEYTAAYIDSNGNAPCVGDDDSGVLFPFENNNKYDHSYLLSLGEFIFDYKFLSSCTRRTNFFKKTFTRTNKIDVSHLTKRQTDKSISLKKGGMYFLKNDFFDLSVACIPIGQNGLGGHNHIDFCSFTVSYKGIPVIVDSGSYSYTKRKKERNEFRFGKKHNIIYSDSIGIFEDEELDYWRLDFNVKYEKIKISDNNLSILYNINNRKFKRSFQIDENKLVINDQSYNENAVSLLHFASNITLNRNFIECNEFHAKYQISNEYQITDYETSIEYLQKEKAQMISVNMNTSNTMEFIFEKKNIN